MNTDYNRLHLFYLIYRHGSIAKAAQELFITQSAVSQNLQKLEQELNITLFHRLPKKLVPTPAAQQLYQVIMPFYSTLNTHLKSINDAETIPQGVIKVGAPPVFGAEFLPGIFSEFRAKYPEVTFELMLGEQLKVVNACRNSELDIALVDIFGSKDEESWNLVQIPLVDEPLILAGSSTYVNDNISDNITVESLSKCQFIAYKSHAPELTEWFLYHFGSATKQLNIVLTVESVHAVIGAIRNNLGFGIVPLYLVQEAIEKKELEQIKSGKDDIRSRISLIRPAGRHVGIVEQLFVKLLKSKFITD